VDRRARELQGPPGGGLDVSAEVGPGPEPEQQLELVMASLRADASDATTFFAVLGEKLADALGDRVRLVRSGGRFRKGGAVERILVNLGDWELEAAQPKGASSPRCTVRHSVRGVVLRSEEVEVDQWLAQLGRTLADEAERSAAARAALQALLS
jgi:hypothetical protein